MLAEALKKEIGEILHVSPERIEDARPLNDLGMDSLMGMELVSAVETRFGVRLPVMALGEGLTINRLVENLIGQLRAPHEAEHDETKAITAQVVGQHEHAADDGLVDDLAASLRAGREGDRSLMDKQ